jgi:hypothetical protein
MRDRPRVAGMTDPSAAFEPTDDALHEPTGDRWFTETWWFSFFDHDRSLGGWLYGSVRSVQGTTCGGAWVWDAAASDPWEIPFYEYFTGLKMPAPSGPDVVAFPTGMTVATRRALMEYDLTYDDRKRFSADLRFDAHCDPVPLRSGEPPYPKAHHFDQTGHVTGHLVLDGERIPIDCWAMRDRSWGPRSERGYSRIGYTWGAAEDTAFLTFSLPGPEGEPIHAGYLLRDGTVARIVSGRREVSRDPITNWVTAITVTAEDEQGRTLDAQGESRSRMFLPAATSLCLNSSMRWDVDGREIFGEDQDVWPYAAWPRPAPSP